ncbi:MAG: hypothetical protein JNK64_41355 [Myxococcales bacterium]|nr:hypothetical protein [Myxococcales bacterium]
MRHLLLLTSLASLLPITACGDDPATPAIDAGGVDAAPREIVTADRTLGVGEIAEGILTGGPADRADLHLAAATPAIDWNIHGHAGGGTQTVTEGLAQLTVDYGFVPSAQGEWFVLVRNGGAAPLAVSVRLELHGAMTWSGWQ